MAKYIKPTLETRFHIDFGWWQKQGRNLRVDLLSHACPEAREARNNPDLPETFDWIDPETGEVFNIDILWHLIHTHCGQETAFIDERTPLTTAIFRAFIAANNKPMTVVELQEKIHKKTPDLILKTIGGRRVFKGIRPVQRG
ncbi:MAG: hypothetical protein D6784_11590 [Chloroflexi bacterium]|nr:MAG: hypothetical protein D6784_11590 [Chloroflexota bacterium]